MASPLGKDLIFLIMQYLDEEKFKDVLHKLEQESGLFFSMRHFEELIIAGKWDEIEKYFSGFTKLDDNRYSMKVYFELRKQKYLEALDNQDRTKAVDILLKDLKVFAGFNGELFKDMTQLLTLENFRENEQLANYRDARSARTSMAAELKKLIEANPLFRGKLEFPTIRASRLRMMVNQSLNWQHSLCPNPKQNPDIKTLYVDHSCRNSSDSNAQLSANNNHLLLSSPPPRPDPTFLAMGTNGSPTVAQVPLLTRVSVPVTPAHLTASSISPAATNGLANLAATIPKAAGASERTLLVPNCPSQIIPALSNWADEFPKSVSRVLTQGSAPTCMDFHPTQQTLLLVGTNAGEISLWEVGSREKLASRSFQIGLVKDQSISVKKILWTSDGNLFGAAFSKNTVQLYRYHGGNDIRKYLEFEAHVGSVNDLAFSNLTKKLCVITCGDDKLIKVWDVGLGSMLYAFEGHSSPVSSVCPHSKENVNYLFSTSVDGRIKAWLYDLGGTRVDYETPGQACTELTYSADGKRLFSCGTSKEGESHVIEWNEAEGTVKRAYQGFRKNCVTAIQFGITKNRFLAVGDDHSIKVWDIDNVNMLTAINADGDLPASPRIRFNKEGSLLAVTANDNKVKILATVDGIRLLRKYENHSLVGPRHVPETSAQNGVVRKPEEVNQRPGEEANAGRSWNVAEITKPSQLRSLRLTTSPNVEKISKLLFTNSGNCILALASNGTHLVWKWARVDQNSSIKATTKVAPQLLSQPTSGNIMSNDMTNVNPEDVSCCIALSKNDSYVMSASGGKITLFNMMSSKTMATFMGPPPVATCLAFHPQDNNVVAIGMDDSTIHIYNVRTDEVKKKLCSGHSKRITGLAFSNIHQTLVSSGADSQIVTWNSESWERQKSSYLNITEVKGEAIEPSATQVQFHIDQTHFLVAHEVQLSIHEVTKLECTKQWVAGNSSPPMSQATFSSDCELVYAIFLDGVIRIFGTGSLQPQCLIKPNAYLPANVTSGVVVGKVMAGHPQEANMVAVGLSDGGVVVLEPLDSETKWGSTLPPEALLPTAPEPIVNAMAATPPATSDSEPQPMTIG